MGLWSFAMASVMTCQFSGVSGDRLIAGRRDSCSEQPQAGRARTSSGKTRCGRRSTPPDAMPLRARASCNGVTSTAPCPMPTEIISPAYHFSCCVFSFHSVDGHHAAGFVRKVDAGLVADADLGRRTARSCRHRACSPACSRRCRRTTEMRCECRPSRDACRRRRSVR